MTDTEVIKNYRRTLGSQPTSRMQEMGSTKILFGRSAPLDHDDEDDDDDHDQKDHDGHVDVDG